MRDISKDDIPNASVRCPALGASVSVRETCFSCRFMRAIAQTNADPRLAWSQAHQLVCGYPQRLVISENVSPADALEAIEQKELSRYG